MSLHTRITLPIPMSSLRFRRHALLAAMLLLPALVAAQTPRAYTIDDLEGMLKNRVSQKRIAELAGRRCLAFVIDSTIEARLRRAGGSAAFVDQLREVCNPNVPRAEQPATPPVQAPVTPPVTTTAAATSTDIEVPVRLVAAMVAPDLSVRAIPQHDMLAISPRGDTVRISTNLEGKVTIPMRPGTWRLESVAPIEVLGNRYRWSVTVPITATTGMVELTQKNAIVEPIAASGGAAAEAPAPVAATPPAPARSRRSEEAELFEKYRSGLFSVFGIEDRGSAFLIDSTGLVLTQAEIIRWTDDVRVQIDSVTKVRAKVLVRDTANDIAVLSIAKSRCASCTPIPLIDPSAGPVSNIGERVLAAGSPLNRSNLMSIGIVNSVDASSITSDVSIGYLNSGGPLLNLDGKAIAVNLYRDGRRPGRPKTSVSLPVTAVLAAIERARGLVAGTLPPSDSLLPLVPVEQFPQGPIAALAAMVEPDLKKFQQSVDKYRVFLMTPQVAGWRAARAQAELAKRRKEGKTKGIVDDRIDPIQHWRDWSDYLSHRKAVVMFNVTPGSTEFPMYDTEKAPEPGAGSVRSVKIYRDGKEIQPIEMVRLPAALTGPERLAAGREIPYQVVAVYRAEDFGPKADGSTPNFAISIQDMSANVPPSPVALSRTMGEMIIRDFTPFFVGLRSR